MQKIAYLFTMVTIFLSPIAMADQTLAMQSGCMACHKIDAKLIGPAFQDIASKYANDNTALERLVSKVKNGSTPGEPLVWGTIMMPPSPASEEKIKGVIEWIMTLN
jgi:cytochrome c